MEFARQTLERDGFLPDRISKGGKRVRVSVEFEKYSEDKLTSIGFGMGKDQPPANMLGDAEEDPETEHGLRESQIIDQMEKLKHTGSYEDFTVVQLRERAIEILTDDIPF